MSLFKACGCVLLIFPWSTPFAADALLAGPMTTDFSNQAGWWTPLVSTADGLYFAFNSPGTPGKAASSYCDDNSSHEVTVGKKIGTGAVATGMLHDAGGSVWIRKDDCGHYAPSIAVDGAGFIHVWADQRSNPDGWQYFRSSKPFDVTDIRRSAGLRGVLPDVDRVTRVRVTYPIARTAPNGDVYVMVSRQMNRVNKAGRSAEPFKRGLALLRWDGKTWAVVNDTVATADLLHPGPDAGIYPDDMQIDSRGEVHMIFSWAVGNDSVRHYGSYLRFDPDARKFFTADGHPAETPVHYRNTPGLVYQGLQDGEQFKDCDRGDASCAAGLQTAKLALTRAPHVAPSIAYRMRVLGEREFSVFHTAWTGTGWAPKTRVTRKLDTTTGLGHTHKGTRARIYFATQDGEMLVAENTDGWKTRKPILKNRKIKQMAVVPQDTGADLVYAQEIDTKAIGLDEGRLYLLQQEWPDQAGRSTK